MSDIVHATSGGVDFPVEIDVERHTWSSTVVSPEGEFPFVLELMGRRLELYSDGTFAEVEKD